MKEVQGYTSHKQSGLLLNANENNYPMPEAVRNDIEKAVAELDFSRYPEDEASDLRETYAKWLGVKPEQIIAGSGSDQMLQLLIQSFLGKDKTLFTLAPDFGMYDFYASAYEANVKRYPFDMQQGMDVDDFIEKAKEAKPDLVLFSNPNNPSGVMLSARDIKKIADELYPVPVASDEAYMEFGKDSALKYLENTENLYITRTLSKAFSLAGIRCGFLISNPENISRLLPNKIVYNLSSLAQKIAQAVLKHADIYEEQTEKTIQQRDLLKKEFEELGLECGPANANYLCVYPKDMAGFVRAFEDAGIQIRLYPGKDYARITIGTPEDNARVLDVLKNLQEAKV